MHIHYFSIRDIINVIENYYRQLKFYSLYLDINPKHCLVQLQGINPSNNLVEVRKENDQKNSENKNSIEKNNFACNSKKGYIYAIIVVYCMSSNDYLFEKTQKIIKNKDIK